MKDRLVKLAKQAMSKAYAPYSDFTVGAALLCEDGSVYTGCNVENASYGVTNCAERTALCKAVSEGKRRFTAMAVCGGKNGVLTEQACTPCGVCRQALREFCNDDFTVYLVTDHTVHTVRLGELLPLSFGPDNLQKSS